MRLRNLLIHYYRTSGIYLALIYMVGHIGKFLCRPTLDKNYYTWEIFTNLLSLISNYLTTAVQRYRLQVIQQVVE